MFRNSTHGSMLPGELAPLDTIALYTLPGAASAGCCVSARFLSRGRIGSCSAYWQIGHRVDGLSPLTDRSQESDCQRPKPAGLGRILPSREPSRIWVEMLRASSGSELADGSQHGGTPCPAHPLTDDGRSALAASPGSGAGCDQISSLAAGTSR
jgi:hypothetical protein